MKDFTLALEGRLTEAIAAREAARARRRRRFLLAVPAVAAAAAVAFAALPAVDPSRTAAPRGAADILRTASAAASQQQGLEGFGGVRYVRQTINGLRSLLDYDVCRGCDPAVLGRVEFEQTGESWVGSDWRGTSSWGEPRMLSGEGDTATWRDPTAPAGEQELRLAGEAVFRIPLDQLPADPEALRTKLEAAIEAPNPSAATRIWELMIGANAILGMSNAPADLRAAAYGMLARIDGATALGETRDSRGRTGQAVVISDSGDRKFTFVIDPRNGTLLESTADYGNGPDTTTTYDASARVSAIGQRP